MNLKKIKIDQLSDLDNKMENVFVEIPFLYHPVMKEFKRKETHIKKIDISINHELLNTEEVLLSFLRLFGIPRKAGRENNSFHFIYADKTINVEFSSSGLTYSGICQLTGSCLIFSENAPYIKVLVDGERESVIVLPEGAGDYYMSLDKNESEKENRMSIIGNPVKLHESYNWLMETFYG
jgi:hypothetical protein